MSTAACQAAQAQMTTCALWTMACRTGGSAQPELTDSAWLLEMCIRGCSCHNDACDVVHTNVPS